MQDLGNSFYLQIGVYKEYNNARRVRDVLNLKGFNARIEHSKSNNKRRYIVLEGIYPSSKLAKLASSDIKKELGYQSIVKKR